jgi:hypothetical protein
MLKNHNSSLYARLRNETMREILDTEEKYVASLEKVVRVLLRCQSSRHCVPCADAGSCSSLLSRRPPETLP